MAAEGPWMYRDQHDRQHCANQDRELRHILGGIEVLASAQQRGAGHERGLLDETTVALAH
jgi:hypothetical protein